MNTTKHLFLDLEETVIEPVVNGWFLTNLINVEKIKAFQTEFNPDFIHVFSFAIWNERERDLFDAGTRQKIERLLGTTLTVVPTVQGDIIPTCAKAKGMVPSCVDFLELINFWGKQDAFRLYVRSMFSDASTLIEVAFLDDDVYNETFEFHDINVKGRIINVDQLSGPERRASIPAPKIGW